MAVIINYVFLDLSYFQHRNNLLRLYSTTNFVIRVTYNATNRCFRRIESNSQQAYLHVSRNLDYTPVEEEDKKNKKLFPYCS